MAIPRSILSCDVDLKSFAKFINPDYIIHCAAYGNKYNQTDDWETGNVNIGCTVNLLYATKGLNYKGFINIGSSSEYGVKNKPMVETDSLDSDTFYGCTKAASTLICRAFAKKYDKPVVTVRPFSVYGEGDDQSKFIQTAIRCFQTNTPLTLSRGVHDWIYIQDFVDGLLTVASHAEEFKGQAVNIGTGKQHSNHAVIGILREIFGKPVKTVSVGQLRNYDTHESWVANIDKLSSLGWEPKFDLERGLSKTVYGK